MFQNRMGLVSGVMSSSVKWGLAKVIDHVLLFNCSQEFAS